MRYVWLGFHVIMALALVAAFSGAFDGPRTGSFAADNGSRLSVIIGIVVIWIIGAIVLRLIRRFVKS